MYPWTAFCLAAAAWVATIWTYHAWISANPHRNALLRLPGISCLNVCPDWQHCKHLGCDAYFYGSVLAYFTDYLMQWDPDTNCDELFVKLRQQYDDLGTKHRLPALRIEMIHATPFPKLKATSSAIAHLGQPLLAVHEQLYDKRKQEDRHIRWALKASVDMEDLLHQHRGEYRLPKAARDKLTKRCEDYLAHITALSNHFHTQNVALFNSTIKSHYLQHMCMMSDSVNPTLTWCYQGEDMMQK